MLRLYIFMGDHVVVSFLFLFFDSNVLQLISFLPPLVLK